MTNRFEDFSDEELQIVASADILFDDEPTEEILINGEEIGVECLGCGRFSSRDVPTVHQPWCKYSQGGGKSPSIPRASVGDYMKGWGTYEPSHGTLPDLEGKTPTSTTPKPTTPRVPTPPGSSATSLVEGGGSLGEMSSGSAATTKAPNLVQKAMNATKGIGTKLKDSGGLIGALGKGFNAVKAIVPKAITKVGPWAAGAAAVGLAAEYGDDLLRGIGVPIGGEDKKGWDLGSGDSKAPETKTDSEPAAAAPAADTAAPESSGSAAPESSGSGGKTRAEFLKGVKENIRSRGGDPKDRAKLIENRLQSFDARSSSYRKTANVTGQVIICSGCRRMTRFASTQPVTAEQIDHRDGCKLAGVNIGDIASGAATGAMVGNLIPIPGVGAGVGALVGGGLGLVKGLFGGDDKKKEEKPKSDATTTTTTTPVATTPTSPQSVHQMAVDRATRPTTDVAYNRQVQKIEDRINNRVEQRH